MNALEVIGKKRDGGEHTTEEIDWLLGAYLLGDVPDYQMAAWLMAVCIRGMTRVETLALTQAMVRSAWPSRFRRMTSAGIIGCRGPRRSARRGG